MFESLSKWLNSIGETALSDLKNASECSVMKNERKKENIIVPSNRTSYRASRNEKKKHVHK